MAKRKPLGKSLNSMEQIIAINKEAKEAGMTYGQYVMEQEKKNDRNTKDVVGGSRTQADRK